MDVPDDYRHRDSYARPSLPATSSNAITLTKQEPMSEKTLGSNIFSGMTFYMSGYVATPGDAREKRKEQACRYAEDLVLAHGGKFSHSPTDPSVTHILIVTNNDSPNDEVIHMDPCGPKSVEYLDRVGWANFRLLQNWGMSDHFRNNPQRNISKRGEEGAVGEKVVLKVGWVDDCVRRGEIIGRNEDWAGWRVRARIRPDHRAKHPYRQAYPSWHQKPALREEIRDDLRPARHPYRPPSSFPSTSRRSSGSTSSYSNRAGSSYRPRYESQSPAPSDFGEASHEEQRRIYPANVSPYDPASLPQVTWYHERAESSDPSWSSDHRSTTSSSTVSTPSVATFSDLSDVQTPAPMFTRSSRDPRLAQARMRAGSYSDASDVSTRLTTQLEFPTRRIASENIACSSGRVAEEPKPVDPRIAWRQAMKERQAAMAAGGAADIQHLLALPGSATISGAGEIAKAVTANIDEPNASRDSAESHDRLQVTISEPRNAFGIELTDSDLDILTSDDSDNDNDFDHVEEEDEGGWFEVLDSESNLNSHEDSPVPSFQLGYHAPVKPIINGVRLVKASQQLPSKTSNTATDIGAKSDNRSDKITDTDEGNPDHAQAPLTPNSMVASPPIQHLVNDSDNNGTPLSSSQGPPRGDYSTVSPDSETERREAPVDEFARNNQYSLVTQALCESMARQDELAAKEERRGLV
ncbi:hypothetical protein I317_01626 [Kwoniella heveanensis CBS 569]|nr:hypothetical protein I317_01626 [Kwoniella heveanensis CBS 569]